MVARNESDSEGMVSEMKYIKREIMRNKCSVCGKPQEKAGMCRECWDEDQQKDYCADLMDGMREPWDIG